MILPSRRGRLIGDGGWLARLAGATVEKALAVVAVAGRPLSSDAALRKALNEAADAGELTITVRADDRDVTLHVRASDPITDEALRQGIHWRGDGSAALTRALAQRLLSDPGQVIRGRGMSW